MKLTQQLAVQWAIAMLQGVPLPDLAPPKVEVVEALINLEHSLERKSGYSRKSKGEKVDENITT